MEAENMRKSNQDERHNNVKRKWRKCDILEYNELECILEEHAKVK